MTTATAEHEEANGTQVMDAEIVTIDAISPLTRAEIDVQIATAKKYPRSVRRFQQDAMSLACLDEETAGLCIFSLPRGGKPIEGPSVRLAEIVASTWGNMRVGARVVDEGERFVTAQGFAFDLERNVAITMEVRRRITNKNGQRYNDDMIVMTGNAAAAIAFRNSVFKCVPKAYWKKVQDAARATALGKIETLAARRSAAVDYVSKMGVPLANLLAAVDAASVEDIGLEKLAMLKSIVTAIKSGDRSVDDAFPAPKQDAAAAVDAKLKSAKNGQQKPPAPETKAPSSETNQPKDETPPTAKDKTDSAGEATPTPNSMDRDDATNDAINEAKRLIANAQSAETINLARKFLDDNREVIGETPLITLRQSLAARQSAIGKDQPTRQKRQAPEGF